MPDHDKRAIVLAYMEDLIDRDEAREALGFHDTKCDTTGDEAVSFADDIIRLEVELAQALEALRSEKFHSEKRYLDGYRPGYMDGYQDGMHVRPNKFIDFTVNGAGGATVSTTP